MLVKQVHADCHNCGKLQMKINSYSIIIIIIIKQPQISLPPTPTPLPISYPLGDIGLLTKHNTAVNMWRQSQESGWYPRHENFQWHLIHLSHESAHWFAPHWVNLWSRVRAKYEQENLKFGDHSDTWRKEMRDFDPIYQLYCEVLSWQWSRAQDCSWIISDEQDCKDIFRVNYDDIHSQLGQGPLVLTWFNFNPNMDK